MIYLTPEDWNNFFLPKLLQDHKSLDAELKKIKNIYSIMSFINSKIKISNQVILSLSMIYFHKYYNQTLISGGFTHNALSLNIDDIKEVFDLIKDKYEYANENLYSKTRNVFNLLLMVLRSMFAV